MPRRVNQSATRRSPRDCTRVPSSARTVLFSSTRVSKLRRSRYTSSKQRSQKQRWKARCERANSFASQLRRVTQWIEQQPEIEIFVVYRFRMGPLELAHDIEPAVPIGTAVGEYFLLELSARRRDPPVAFSSEDEEGKVVPGGRRYQAQ